MTTPATNLLEGQAAIVTGAAQGIGLAIAAGLLAHGASVLLADVDQGKVTEAAEGLAARNRAAGCEADVMSAADHDVLVRMCLERFGRLDVLVNNAGITRDAYI